MYIDKETEISVPENQSGIYMILNTINDKYYIGSAINLSKRRSNHFSDLRRNVHSNIHLQRAYNKYGEMNFKFILVELVDDSTTILAREQYYIDLYNASDDKYGYNICSIAGSNLGRIFDDVSKEKMSISAKKRKASKSTKEILSKAHKGEKHPFYGKKHSEESKHKMSQARSGIYVLGNSPRAKKVINTDTNKVFLSIKEAAMYYDCSKSYISYVCRNVESKHKGYHWMYYEEYLKENSDNGKSTRIIY
jgi:group I intron endonuclease